MAKLAVKIAVFFSVFLLSQAHNPSFLPDDAVHETFPSSTVTENDVKTLVLPWEKSESDVIPSEKLESAKAFETVAVGSILRPLPTSFEGRFRPISRRFPNPHGTRPLLFRSSRHHCRHRPHTRGTRFQIPYGNDMILADGKGKDDMLQIPARISRFPGEIRGPNMGVGIHKKWYGGEGGMRPRHFHLEEKERGEGSFGNWFREILNRF